MAKLCAAVRRKKKAERKSRKGKRPNYAKTQKDLEQNKNKRNISW